MKNKTNVFLLNTKKNFLDFYSRAFNRNIKIKVLLFLIICFCIVGITSTKVTSQDEEEIIVHKKFGDVPVKLVSVTAEKKEVSLGKTFAKTSGWYKGLEFEIENTSGKTITYMSLQLRFTRPKELQGSSGPDKYGYSMVIPYGEMNDFFANKRTGVEIKPNEVVQIPLKENYYNTLSESLAKLGYPSKFQGVEIVIHEIGFSDGMLWSYALWYKQEPGNPARWTPILEKKTEKLMKPLR